MVREALRRADSLAACSRFIADLVRDEYGLDVRLVAQPFAIEEFPLGDGPPDGRPTILSVGDFTVRRKGVRCLVRAFAGVLRQHPDARLRLSGRMHDELKSELLASVPPSVSPAIEFLGLGRVEDVPRLYQQASVLALPSMWEPSGIVMMEAWASGAPVVATDHGGLPEFMGRGVGALFDPRTNGEETANADGLTQAILDGLAMSAQAGIRRRCREYAEQYTWGVWGPKFEELYRS
jgi:phosphatidylinositol alpha-mannosyltransferase